MLAPVCKRRLRNIFDVVLWNDALVLDPLFRQAVCFAMEIGSFFSHIASSAK